MIAQFPTFYPDELLYSLLSRYYVRSGHSSLRDCMKDLYGRNIRPVIEFSDQLTPEVYHLLGNLNDVILQHTMFPDYARFISADSKIKAFNSLLSGTKEYNNLLYFPKSTSNTRHLKYCPECAAEDRKLYGETYWHRSHQVYGTTICHKHNCFLQDSSVLISSKASPSLTAAETVVPILTDIEYCSDEIVLQLNQYLVNVFMLPLTISEDTKVSEFIKYRISFTKYISGRGKHIWAEMLYQEMAEYYSSTPQSTLTSSYQLTKILTNNNKNPLTIAMLCMFLQIDHRDLQHMHYEDINLAEELGAEIKSLHKKGLSYVQISQRIGLSYDYTKLIATRKKKKKHSKNKNVNDTRKQEMDYISLDLELYPKIVSIIEDIKTSPDKPVRMTISAIEQLFNLPNRSIAKMPKCYELVLNNSESREQYWIRELKWNYLRLQECDVPLTITNLAYRSLNISKANLLRTLPFLNYSDPLEKELIRLITQLSE